MGNALIKTKNAPDPAISCKNRCVTKRSNIQYKIPPPIIFPRQFVLALET